jgi:hypothetical protein
VWRKVKITPPYSLRVVRGDRKGTKCPEVQLGITSMRQRSKPKIDYSANYRPVLSSERASHFRFKKFLAGEKKR